MRISDIYNAQVVAARVEENILQRPPFALDAIFPSMDVWGSKIKVEKMKATGARLLNVSRWDDKVILLDKPPVEVAEFSLPFHKNSERFTEDEMKELQTLLRSNAPETEIRMWLNSNLGTRARLVMDAEATAEEARARALRDGVLMWNNNGVNFYADFDIPNTNRVATGTIWTDTANSTPIADLRAWQEQVEDAGYEKPTVAWMNRNTFNNMIQSAEITSLLVNVVSTNIIIPTRDSLKMAIETYLGLTIMVYDKSIIGTENANGIITTTAQKYIPDGRVILTPADSVGGTAFGDTPLMYQELGAGLPFSPESPSGVVSSALVRFPTTGTATRMAGLFTFNIIDPYNVETKIEMTQMPFISRPDEIIIANVNSTSAPVKPVRPNA